MNQTSATMLETAGQELTIAPPGIDELSTDEVIWRLRQSLDMNLLKRRQASGQGTVKDTS